MKKLFDISLTLFLLFFSSIIMLIIYLILKFHYKTKPIYYSKRIGKFNKSFLMPKFRTMLENSPQLSTNKINKKYITPFGRLLRKSSLDELPQLFSILKGDMSLVGPRPALYNQYYLIKLRTRKKIHHLLPGITGWAQINGRDFISIYKKVELDFFYKKNNSVLFDLKIMTLTILAVFNNKDIKH